MYCHNCGAKAVENAKFCMECGTKLITQQTDNTPNNQLSEIPSPVPKWLEGLSLRLQKARWLGDQYDKDSEALKLAQEEMKEQPSLEALEIILNSYVGLNQFDKAQQTVDEMKQFGASQAVLYLYQAYIFLCNEKLKEAKSLFQKALDLKDDLSSKYQEALLFFGLSSVQMHLGEENFKFLEQTLKLKEYGSSTMAKYTYYMRGVAYLKKEQHSQAYSDFVSAQKEGFMPDADFCYFRAISGFFCGQMEYIQEDIKCVLNSEDATESDKKEMQELKEKLAENANDFVINDEVVQKAHSKFYDKILETIEKYKQEEDLHTAVTMFSSENIKYMMKHSVKDCLNYWEQTFYPIMTPQLKTDFITAKKDIKHLVDENFNMLADRANILIDDVIENVPKDSWLEVGKNFLKGALTGYLGGGLGVLGLMFDQSKEEKNIDKTINKWNVYFQQIVREYDDVYSNIIEHIGELVDKYNIPTNISNSDDDTDDDDEDDD